MNVLVMGILGLFALWIFVWVLFFLVFKDDDKVKEAEIVKHGLQNKEVDKAAVRSMRKAMWRFKEIERNEVKKCNTDKEIY